jgi:hypothetical protein
MQQKPKSSYNKPKPQQIPYVGHWVYEPDTREWVLIRETPQEAKENENE